MLTCGIVGLPTVGKTTLFNLLTNAEVEVSTFFSGKAESNVGIARVPDERIDWLSKMFKPRKTTYAQIQFSDVPGLVRGSSEGKGVGNQFLSGIRTADALVQVIRVFEDDKVMHVDETIDPVRDMDTVNTELLLADLQVVENRITRLKTGKKMTKENEQELEILVRIKDALENERLIQELGLTEEERSLLTGYAFMTEKPMIVVVNLDEEQLRSGSYPRKDELKKLCEEKALPLIELCSKIEVEINKLADEDKQLFMEDYGIHESGVARVAKATYESLGLISFFTVGEDEVRAWTIPNGINAKKAGGKIHSDIEKGFIKAETVAYSDLIGLGSMNAVKEAGLFRLEGKDYIIKDADIINFRFNV